MPSVQLSRLREQIIHLLANVDRPEAFQRSLRDLLERYSEHAYRSGEGVTPRSLLPTYRVPALVYRQLENDLAAACSRVPVQLLRVADVLWTDDHLEPRLLAALILGQLPINFLDEVVARLKVWVHPGEDRMVLSALMDQGASTLRKENPEKLFDIIHTWLDDTRIAYKQLGLQTLESLIQDPDFQNIPPLFRLLSPFLSAPPPQLMNHLHLCLRGLAKKSPGETAYFLHQSIGLSKNPTTARLIRRVLPDFPENFRENLRLALRNRADA